MRFHAVTALFGLATLLSTQLISAQDGLPIPVDPQAVCTGDAVSYMLRSNKCACGWAIRHYHTPGPDCCRLFSDTFGPAATAPTRNCFCVEDFWTAFSDATAEAYRDFEVFFETCNLMGFRIAYAGDNATCNDVFPSIVLADEKAVHAYLAAEAGETPPPMPSLGTWLHGVHADPLVAVGVAVMVPSTFGFLALLWPLLYNTVWTVRTSTFGRSLSKKI